MAESVLRKDFAQDIPELTYGPFAALRHRVEWGRALLNRGGTVELTLHPQCGSIEDEAFYFFNKSFKYKSIGGYYGISNKIN